MTEFGKPQRHYAECGSTNDVAREWALNLTDPAPSGALVTADFQTRGRGRRGHQWQADAGQSALMSYVYRVPSGLNPSQLGLVAAIAAAEACRAFGVFPEIKWPNDILLGGKKVGGILVEAAAGIAVLGIGVNVSQAEFADASEYANPPTSLRLASGQEQSVAAVINAAASALTHAEALWRRKGFLPIVERCRACLAAGVLVRRGEAAGVLIGLTERGEAVVQAADGTFAEWATVD